MSDQPGLNIGAIEGMERAADHAERDLPGWGERAYYYLRLYVASHTEPFVAPELRAWAHRQGLEQPPSAYAWGSVFHRARRAGLISPEGYRQYGDDTMHTQSVRVWKAK